MKASIVLVCFAHGSAIGPFDTPESAISFIKSLVDEVPEIDCQFDTLPMMEPDVEIEVIEPKGYL